MNNCRKYLVIGIIILFVGVVVFPNITADYDNVNKVSKGNNTVKTSSLPPDWYDDFDSYAVYSYLHGQGGWTAYNNDIAYSSTITNFHSLSSPNSVIVENDDWMYYHFSGVNYGKWKFKFNVFTMSNSDCYCEFLLLNTYPATQSSHISTDLIIDTITDEIKVWPEMISLPLVNDYWSTVVVEIDFESNSQRIYYRDELLFERDWTIGGDLNLASFVFKGQSGPGVLYLDDCSLIGVREFQVKSITGGLGITVVIANVGYIDAANVHWNIDAMGGILKQIHKGASGDILNLAAGEEKTVSLKPVIFGLGRLYVNVFGACRVLECEEFSFLGTEEGIQLLFLTIL